MDSYISSEECELSSLCIVMFRLWAYHQISGNYLLNQESYGIRRSLLFPLRHFQDHDFEIQYRPNFEIRQSAKQINNENFVGLQQQTQQQNGPIAFLNRPGASYGDAVIFTEPPIVLQEKQSILSRSNILEGKKPNLIGASVFNIERAKINNDQALFVMITDERERIETQMLLGGRDILICWDEPGSETLYAKFAGKFLSLRRITQLGISTLASQMEIDFP